MMHRAWSSIVEVPYCFPRSSIKFQGTRYKTLPILTQIGRFLTIGQSQLSNPSDLPCSRSSVKFQGHSDVHAKGQRQRSKVKVTEVNTQLSRFRTVNPVWIHIWWWNDAQSLMLLRRGALLFFKVIHQISRSEGSKNRPIWLKLAFPDCNSSLNSPMAMKWCTKLEVA